MCQLLGNRKIVKPIAERLATGSYDQLHDFITDRVWDATPLEAELLNQADWLVGSDNAVLVINDTPMPKSRCSRALATSRGSTHRATVRQAQSYAAAPELSAPGEACRHHGAAVEPVIGHVHPTDRNYLKGPHQRRIDAVLAAAGYNFGLLLRWLAALLRASILALAELSRLETSLKSALVRVLHGTN